MKRLPQTVLVVKGTVINISDGPDRGQWVSTKEGWRPYNRWITLDEFNKNPEPGLYQWKDEKGNKELCQFKNGHFQFISEDYRDRRFDNPQVMRIHLPE